MSTKTITSAGKGMKLAVIVAFAGLALGPVASVSAQGTQEVIVTGTKAPPGSEVQSKTVDFADLDLSKSQGLRTLLSRIRAAAGEVCSPRPQATDIPGTKDYNKCLSSALGGALAKVDNPGLTAMASKGAH